MTATIVPFGKKTPAKIQKSIKAAEDGLELTPPSRDDLKGFINTLNFLALQSMAKSATVDVMDGELNVKIQHHERADFVDADGVMSATMFEVMAGVDFTPENPNKMIDHLLIAFDRLNLDNYEDFEVEGTLILEDEDNETE